MAYLHRPAWTTLALVALLALAATTSVACGSLAGLLGGEQATSEGRQPYEAGTWQVPGGDPERGRRAMQQQYGCGACHAIPGVPGADGMVGPPLVSFARRTVIAGQLPNTPENLIRWIQDPQGVEPGTAMPDMGVTDADARDIAAYMYTLR